MYKTLIPAAFTAAVAIAAPAVHADDVNGVRTPARMTVPLRDIDLNNPAQARIAYDRVVSAAHDVCDSQIDDATVQADDQACERQAIKSALDALQQPALYRIAADVDSKTSQQLAFNDRR